MIRKESSVTADFIDYLFRHDGEFRKKHQYERKYNSISAETRKPKEKIYVFDWLSKRYIEKTV